MISMIRSFYLRKIKFTQQTYHDKLSLILNEVGAVLEARVGSVMLSEVS